MLKKLMQKIVTECKQSFERLLDSRGHAFVGTFVPAILIHNFETIGNIILMISIVMGLGLFYGALHQFKRYGEMRTMMSQQGSINGPMVMLVAAVLLLVLPAFIHIFLFSLWGDANPMAYDDTGGAFGGMMLAIVMFVRIIGVCSVIRGIVLISRAGGGAQGQSQPGTMSKALIHLIGGILCINVIGTYNILHYIFFGG